MQPPQGPPACALALVSSSSRRPELCSRKSQFSSSPAPPHPGFPSPECSALKSFCLCLSSPPPHQSQLQDGALPTSASFVDQSHTRLVSPHTDPPMALSLLSFSPQSPGPSLFSDPTEPRMDRDLHSLTPRACSARDIRAVRTFWESWLSPGPTNVCIQALVS